MTDDLALVMRSCVQKLLERGATTPFESTIKRPITEQT